VSLGKVSPFLQAMKALRESRGIALPCFYTTALEGVRGQRHAPAALPPEKTRYPLYWRLGGPQGRSGQVRKISPPPGFNSPDRPARSQSLYRLSYPDHRVSLNTHKLTDQISGADTNLLGRKLNLKSSEANSCSIAPCSARRNFLV
jgi:hypothetical protein